jgi:hypothetical protein
MAIVDSQGRPTSTFTDFFNVQFAEKIEKQENAQGEVISDIQELVSALQAAVQATQVAQETANNASSGGGASGSATNPAVDLLVGAGWVAGPQVDLTGVVAGNLSIVGSGPIQDEDVMMVAVGKATGNYNWRVVEIEGASETVVFSGTFLASQFSTGSVASITNQSTVDAANASIPRTSVGDISYRIDAEASTIDLSDLSLYLFVRRS